MYNIMVIIETYLNVSRIPYVKLNTYSWKLKQFDNVNKLINLLNVSL